MTEPRSGDHLPAGVWFRRFPWKVGAITFIHNVLNEAIRTIFEFEFIIAFPITLILDIRYREFFTGSEVCQNTEMVSNLFMVAQ